MDAPRRRIAFCITDLDSGGAEKALLQLVSGLNSSRWECRVYCLGPEGSLAEPLRTRGIFVECYGARHWRDLGVFLWLSRRLREFSPDLLQCFLFHANLVGRVAGRWARVPVVLSGHRVAEQQKKWHLWLDRWTAGLVDHHVCVSRGVQTHVCRHLGIALEKTSVIPNGVSIPNENQASDKMRELLKTCQFTEDAQIVLAVGRLHPQKGFLNLLQAFRRVAEQLPTSRLLIVGEGPQRMELEQSVHSLGLNDSICLPGWCDDVMSLMRHARVLAVTSAWEGMPNVVLEAMSVGLPVVAMQVEGLEELIQNEERGIIVTQGDIGAFTDSLVRVLRRPDWALQLGKSSQEFVSKNFTWGKMVEDYERIYLQLIN